MGSFFKLHQHCNGGMDLVHNHSKKEIFNTSTFIIFFYDNLQTRAGRIAEYTTIQHYIIDYASTFHLNLPALLVP